jgi:hypothetical protein
MRVFRDICRAQGQGNNKSMPFTLLGTNQLKFSRNVPELNHDVSSYEHMNRIWNFNVFF